MVSNSSNLINLSPHPSRKYQFRLEEVEPFRYRATDAYKAVTGIAIRESRLKEIKSEIFNNKKLKVSKLEIQLPTNGIIQSSTYLLIPCRASSTTTHTT